QGDRPAPLPVGGNCEVSRAAPVGKAPGPLARACSSRRLPPRPDRVTKPHESPTHPFRWAHATSYRTFHNSCGYPSTGGCQQDVENGSYAGFTSRGQRQRVRPAARNGELDSRKSPSWGLTATTAYTPFGGDIK